MFPTRAGSDYAGGSGIRQSHLKYIISAISDRFLADPIWPRCQDPLYQKMGDRWNGMFRWQFAQIQGLASTVASWLLCFVALSQRAKNILNLQLPILSTFIDLKWMAFFFLNSRRSQENRDGYKLIQIVLAASSFLGSGSNFIDIVCWVFICHENQWLWIGMNWVISVNNSNGWLSCLHATLSHVLYSVGCTQETHLQTQQHKPGLFAFPFLTTIHQRIHHNPLWTMYLSYQCLSPRNFQIGNLVWNSQKKSVSLDGLWHLEAKKPGIFRSGCWHKAWWNLMEFFLANLLGGAPMIIWDQKSVCCASPCREENPCVMVSCGLSIYM